MRCLGLTKLTGTPWWLITVHVMKRGLTDNSVVHAAKTSSTLLIIAFLHLHFCTVFLTDFCVYKRSILCTVVKIKHSTLTAEIGS